MNVSGLCSKVILILQILIMWGVNKTSNVSNIYSTVTFINIQVINITVIINVNKNVITIRLVWLFNCIIPIIIYIIVLMSSLMVNMLTRHFLVIIFWIYQVLWNYYNIYEYPVTQSFLWCQKFKCEECFNNKINLKTIVIMSIIQYVCVCVRSI